MKITDENFCWKNGTIYICGIFKLEVSKGNLMEIYPSFGRVLSTNEASRLDLEPFIDWSKVPADTKVEVSNDGVVWHKRHFDSFEKGLVYVFADGRTSHTQYLEGITSYGFKYARLYEGKQ